MGSRFDFYIPSSDGLSRIHGIHWLPDSDAAAVIQISHGMLEHAGRYGAFAEAMNAKGIAVIGHDHLGHGKTARPGCLGTFSDRDGAFYVLEDIRCISDFTERQYPSVPHFILGHSMGSFFVRRFLTICGEQVDGAIIMGTGSKPAVVLKLGTMVVRRAIKKEGRDYHNETLHRLVLGSYNKPFEPGETEHDWLSRDIAENRKYEADPDCRFIFSNGAYEDFFQVMTELVQKKQFEQIPKTLPVLLLSGAQDPVGDKGRGVKKVYREFCSLGMSDVRIKLYPRARHELLNELNRDEVYRDIESFVLGEDCRGLGLRAKIKSAKNT